MKGKPQTPKMESERRNISNKSQDEDYNRSLNVFLESFWQTENTKKSRCSNEEQPSHCATWKINDCTFRILRKPSVCRRINFDNPNDKEWQIKKVKLQEMMLLHRVRKLENEDNEQRISRKRKTGDEISNNIKRMKYF